jgi:hypothetical protein
MKLEIVLVKDWADPKELIMWFDEHVDVVVKTISRIDTMFYIFYE